MTRLLVVCVPSLVLGLLPVRAVAQTATYAEHVAPILNQHCVTCHRPGAIGPISFTRFESVRPWARAIRQEVTTRRMPPWKPVGMAGRFEGERRLTDAEIATLARWADAGAPEGDPSALPPPPVFEDDWQLGPPDLVVTPPEAFRLDPDGEDVYRNFAVPLLLTSPRWVRAVELRPASTGVVHHARMLLDTTGRARAADAEDAGPGYDGFMLDHGGFPDGHFLGWAPGKRPTEVPADLAWPLVPGTDLVLQLHLLPGDEPADVRPSVGFYFSDEAPVSAPVSALLSSKTIDIPAGEANYTVTDRLRLPVAVDLLAIYPHAHDLGRRITATAIRPDGSRVPLLRIDDWDFNWQDEYRYRQPVRLPADTVVEMEMVFDNSAANPRNPNDPPQVVRFGAGARDEMAELMLQVLPDTDADSAALGRMLAIKYARDDILGYQARLRVEPTDHMTLTALAARYLEVGEVDLALQHLGQAIDIDPDYPEAHYNLGSALLARGDTPGAIAAYRRAIAARPDYATAHNNVGALLEASGAPIEALAHYRLAVQYDPGNASAFYNLAHVLQGQGVLEEAIVHYRRSMELNPSDPETYLNLGRIYVMQQRFAQAVDHYRQALALDGSYPPALLDLAWVRAGAPDAQYRDGEEAIGLAQRAGALVGQDHPMALDPLAAAYAEAGRFQDATATAVRAVEQAALVPGLQASRPEMEARLALYLDLMPFRLVGPIPGP